MKPIIVFLLISLCLTVSFARADETFNKQQNDSILIKGFVKDEVYEQLQKHNIALNNAISQQSNVISSIEFIGSIISIGITVVIIVGALNSGWLFVQIRKIKSKRKELKVLSNEILAKSSAVENLVKKNEQASTIIMDRVQILEAKAQESEDKINAFIEPENLVYPSLIEKRNLYKVAPDIFQLDLLTRHLDYRSYFLLGLNYHYKQNLDDAIIYYEEAIKEDTKNSEAHLMKAFALYSNSITDKSISSFNEALQLNKNLHIAYHYLGKIEEDNGWMNSLTDDELLEKMKVEIPMNDLTKALTNMIILENRLVIHPFIKEMYGKIKVSLTDNTCVNFFERQYLALIDYRNWKGAENAINNGRTHEEKQDIFIQSQKFKNIWAEDVKKLLSESQWPFLDQQIYKEYFNEFQSQGAIFDKSVVISPNVQHYDQ